MGVRGALRGLRLDAESNAIEFEMRNLLNSEFGMGNAETKMEPLGGEHRAWSMG